MENPKGGPKPGAPTAVETPKGKLVKDASGHWQLIETPAQTQPNPELHPATSLAEQVIANVLAQSAIQLARVGVKTGRLDAELMMMHALGWEKEKLVKRWTDKLNNDQYNRYQKLLQRRLNREPLAYIVGYKYFYELKFFVDDRVLIPRPETEIMVEKALSILRKMGTETDQFSLVDVGTGCGNIALSIANRVNFIKIFAVDDAFDAIEVAKINAVLLGLEQNVGFIRGDMLSALPHPVNLILANLPYIPETQYAQLEPEIVKYEPKSALTAGPDGLDAYRRLFAQAPQYLLRGGKIICELDPPQIPELKTIILRNIPSATIEVTPDLQGNERLVTVHTS